MTDSMPPVQAACLTPKDSDPSIPSKPEEKPLLAEIKNGKAILKQKPVNFEKNSETLLELVAFREMMENNAANSTVSLDAIPDEHRSLVAKLVHESDKSLSSLVKHVTAALTPDTEDDDDEVSPSCSLSSTVVETVVRDVASRINYGMDPISGYKPPANLCIWRWEVKPELVHFLPKNARDKAVVRRNERVQAKEGLIALFQTLPPLEQENLFGVKPCNLKFKQFNTPNGQPIVVGDVKPGESSKMSSLSPKKLQGTENDIPGDQPPKIIEPAKVAKEQARLEKKNAKAEREKKDEEAHRKAQSMMNNFFKKPREIRKKSPFALPSKAVASDFAKTFKSFVVRKNTEMAPINRFREPPKEEEEDQEIIILDKDDSTKLEGGYESLTASMTRFVHQIDSLRTFAMDPSHPTLPRTFVRKASTSPLSVRDLFSKLSEAEVAGDVAAVQLLHKQLANRQLRPAKVLIFADDNRPGYFGTFTKPSRTIRPCKPLSRDILAFDYGYDSGEDWEDETGGDGEDIVEDEEDEEVEDLDSEIDDWLVGDDEVELQDPAEPSPRAAHRKRKVPSDEDHSPGKRRKVVIPLVPFAKGPCHESTIGLVAYEPFKAYAIRPFHNTPLPIDPFTFVSSNIRERETQPSAPKAEFLLPQLPPRLTDHTSEGPKKQLAPKMPFPDEHFPYLVQRITDLKASSLPGLVDNVYQDLKAHKVKKNAIEAKIRLVAERSKSEKVWVMKPIATKA